MLVIFSSKLVTLSAVQNAERQYDADGGVVVDDDDDDDDSSEG
jgi:hypothetical protein